MRFAVSRLALSALAAGALLLPACPTDEGTEGEGEGEGEAQTVTVTISAAAGGTIEDATGKAALVIPAGALAADTEITLTTTPAANGAEGDQYDFGPDGLQFLAPATLSVQFDGVVPTDKVAALARYESGTTWTPLENGAVSGTTVSGDVEHFTTFSIVFIDGEVIITSACTEVFDAFTPCGGDIVGTWQFQDVCAPATSLGQNPYAQVPGCEDTVFEMALEVDATFTITATTTERSAGTTTLSRHVDMSLACLAALVPEGACADQTGVDGFFELDVGETGACTDNGTRCDCTGTQVSAAEASGPEPYTIDEATHEIVGTDDQGAEKRTAYCRVDDDLHLGGKNDQGALTSVVVLAPAPAP